MIRSFSLYCILAILIVPPAYGQVIEIDAQGTTTTYDRPTIFTDEGVVSVLPRRAVRAVSRAASFQPMMSMAGVEKEFGLHPGLLDAVVFRESRGRMDAVSPKGALGIMQLMPGTAAELGVDPRDLQQNIRGGALYLKRQIDRFGSVPLGLAAYNAGPGSVMRYGGIPPYRETRAYVSAIMARWQPTAAPIVTGPIQPIVHPFLIEVSAP
jgi:hypothetical protein